MPRLVAQAAWITSTPSPSPEFGDHSSLPVVATDELGMIADDESEHGVSGSPHVRQQRQRSKKQISKQPRRHRSKHFIAKDTFIATPPPTPPKPPIGNLGVGDLSSDSSLTEVPSDIGPDPFACDTAVLVSARPPKVKHPSKSPYFPEKPRPKVLSCLPFPPLSAPKFGLMQERLARDPFRLLIATVFLNRTRGEHAMPVFCRLMDLYPTVADLADARVEEVVQIIHRLGFQNQRARKCIEIAKAWQRGSPVKGRRYRKLNYPIKGDGRDVQQGECIGDEDGRVAWEISFLPGLGPYSHDSWRIFCRDQVRGLSESWNGEGAPVGFEPEWKRVLPMDKELRAYLTWMWMKEGWLWNKETGERVKADPQTLEMIRGGGTVQEEQDQDHLLVIT